MARQTPEHRALTHIERAQNAMRNLAKVKGLSQAYRDQAIAALTQEVADTAAAWRALDGKKKFEFKAAEPPVLDMAATAGSAAPPAAVEAAS